MTDHGRTKSGLPLTDELIDELGKRAAAGYETEKILRRRRARPPIGSAAAASNLSDSTRSFATRSAPRRANTTTSAVIREALRRFLDDVA